MHKESDENLRHFGVNSPYELATTGNPDPRTEKDLASDWVDPNLTGFLQSIGYFEAGQEQRFSRDVVLNIARAAYGKGLKDGSDDPEGVKKYMTEDYTKARKQLQEGQVASALLDIHNLPETPPEAPNN